MMGQKLKDDAIVGSFLFGKEQWLDETDSFKTQIRTKARTYFSHLSKK